MSEKKEKKAKPKMDLEKILKKKESKRSEPRPMESKKLEPFSSTSMMEQRVGDRSDLRNPSISLSMFSFKEWHRRMQRQHDENYIPDFTLYSWCEKACRPCRWFDRIEYNIKICKCCLKFKTFKQLVTSVMFCGFLYLLMFAHLRKELLPGGTLFFMFLLFVTSYTAGMSLMYAGLPLMYGNLLAGVAFGNVPKDWLPDHDDALFIKISQALEKLLLILGVIRAGLLIDISRLKGLVRFVLRLSFCPLICEFALVWIASHYLLKLPWEWAALQGSVLCCVSLSCITTTMQHNRAHGYGEEKNLATVLIAAAAIQVVATIFMYIVCISYIFPHGNLFYKGSNVLANTLVSFVVEAIFGLTLGFTGGLLVAFFPDKRNSEAAVLRISIIGLGSLSLASVLNMFEMPGAAVLGTLTLCFVARNMWEELGWHDESNPVQYFYSVIHYFGQPVALALVGFTIRFSSSSWKPFIFAATTIIIGLIGREIVCFTTTISQMYSTTGKEKLYICIAWCSKGTFQGLLALAVTFLSQTNFNIEVSSTFDSDEEKDRFERVIKNTAVLAIVLTTPLASYGLHSLTTKLLTKHEDPIII